MWNGGEAFDGRLEDRYVGGDHTAQTTVQGHIHFEVAQAAMDADRRREYAGAVIHGELVVAVRAAGFGQHQGALGGTVAAAFALPHVVHHGVVAVPDIAGPQTVHAIFQKAAAIAVKQKLAVRIAIRGATLVGIHRAVGDFDRRTAAEVEAGLVAEMPDQTVFGELGEPGGRGA